MSRYDPARIEPKWQTAWEEAGCFTARRDPARPKYYVLEMFPYHLRGDACADSYVSFFDDAVSMIDEACGSFVPQ